MVISGYCITQLMTASVMVDDKQLKFEIKEVHSSIHELANDLGGDIRYLHQEISELRETIDLLQQDIRQLKEQINGS